MGLFSFFKSNSNWKRTLVRDLIILSTLDGDVDDTELTSLVMLCQNFGVSQIDFLDVLTKIRSNQLNKLPDIYPTELTDKINYMQALIEMTYADGTVDENEIKFMKIVSEAMRLPPNAVDRTIAKIAINKEKEKLISLPISDVFDLLIIIKNKDPNSTNKGSINLSEVRRYIKLLLMFVLQHNAKIDMDDFDDRIMGFIDDSSEIIYESIKNKLN